MDFSLWTKLLDLLRQITGPGVGPITTYSYKYIFLSFIVDVPLIELSKQVSKLFAKLRMFLLLLKMTWMHQPVDHVVIMDAYFEFYGDIDVRIRK